MSEHVGFRILYNAMSLVGVVIAFTAFTILFSFAVVDLTSETELSYIGLVYGVAVVGILLGAAISAVGILVNWLRYRSGVELEALSFVIDLSNRRQRVRLIVALVSTFMLLIVVFSASYQTVAYLDSNAFCTDACHSVMAPEGTTHANTAHSQVDCVECHIASGGAGTVAAKLRGVGQFAAVLTGGYAKPIPTPIHTMQPARYTCEQCHWRQRWIGFREKVYTYYGSDDENPVNHLRLLLKIGGARSGLIKGEGIHYHMTIGRRVEFITRDERKQDVAWIRIEDLEGEVKEFHRSDRPLTDEERLSLPIHEMDCMDCRNRTAHDFAPPMPLVNVAMAGGEIDASIPGIKREAVTALSANYDSTQEALQKIEAHMLAYLAEAHEDFLEDNREMVDDAIAAVQGLLRRSQFPEMKVRWSAYPDNLGHRDWPGCFRCHNESMVDENGEPVFADCRRCHIVLAQTRGEASGVDYEHGQDFFHVVDDETLEEFSDCTDCHDGGDGVY